MPPLVSALVDFGHLLGAILGIGGLCYLGLIVLPSLRQLPEAERATLQAALRTRGRVLSLTAIALLVATGLLKWLPAAGGVGWLGHGGIRTGLLHGKLGLALLVFHQVFMLTRKPRDEAEAARRPFLVRRTALLGLAVVLLAVLHQTGI